MSAASSARGGLGLVVAAVAAAVLASPIDAAPVGAASVCPATRLDGVVVQAGPFAGGAVPRYDSVGGRFSLRVGGWRTKTLSSKIPWFIPDSYEVGDVLVVTGRRVAGSPRTFRQTMQRVSGGNGRWVFPSIIDPPSVGCWKLTFRSGKAVGSMTMLARPAIAR